MIMMQSRQLARSCVRPISVFDQSHEMLGLLSPTLSSSGGEGWGEEAIFSRCSKAFTRSQGCVVYLYKMRDAPVWSPHFVPDFLQGSNLGMRGVAMQQPCASYMCNR